MSVRQRCRIISMNHFAVFEAVRTVSLKTIENFFSTNLISNQLIHKHRFRTLKLIYVKHFYVFIINLFSFIQFLLHFSIAPQSVQLIPLHKSHLTLPSPRPIIPIPHTLKSKATLRPRLMIS